MFYNWSVHVFQLACDEKSREEMARVTPKKKICSSPRQETTQETTTKRWRLGLGTRLLLLFHDWMGDWINNT